MMAVEQEDIYSMFGNLLIRYDDIIASSVIIDYCSKNSDSFSIITKLKKPYSCPEPNCEHDTVLQPIKPYMINQIVGLRSWPGTISIDKHKVLNLYKICKKTRVFLNEIPNIFWALNNNLPEDVCFYRNDKPWFVTCTHEQLAVMVDVSTNDFYFLKDSGIRFQETYQTPNLIIKSF